MILDSDPEIYENKWLSWLKKNYRREGREGKYLQKENILIGEKEEWKRMNTFGDRTRNIFGEGNILFAEGKKGVEGKHRKYFLRRGADEQ